MAFLLSGAVSESFIMVYDRWVKEEISAEKYADYIEERDGFGLLIKNLRSYREVEDMLERIRGQEEERRMFYVALTRAKNTLRILYRTDEGLKPSRFIEASQIDHYSG